MLKSGKLKANRDTGITQNVTFRVLDAATQEVVQEAAGHNQATNTLLMGIAHHLMGLGVTDSQVKPMLRKYIPVYISLGTMGLESQEQDDRGLPIITDYIKYMEEQPGYGADGYKHTIKNHNRPYPGLGPSFKSRNTAPINKDLPDTRRTVNCELVSDSAPRVLITERNIKPEYMAEKVETVEVVYTAMISTGMLSQFMEEDKSYIFITEAGLWSSINPNTSRKSDLKDEPMDGYEGSNDGQPAGENGLLAGYRLIPPNTENQIFGKTDTNGELILDEVGRPIDKDGNPILDVDADKILENQKILKQQILRVGKNQVVQVVWKIQIGSVASLNYSGRGCNCKPLEGNKNEIVVFDGEDWVKQSGIYAETEKEDSGRYTNKISGTSGGTANSQFLIVGDKNADALDDTHFMALSGKSRLTMHGSGDNNPTLDMRGKSRVTVDNADFDIRGRSGMVLSNQSYLNMENGANMMLHGNVFINMSGGDKALIQVNPYSDGDTVDPNLPVCFNLLGNAILEMTGSSNIFMHGHGLLLVDGNGKLLIHDDSELITNGNARFHMHDQSEIITNATSHLHLHDNTEQVLTSRQLMFSGRQNVFESPTLSQYVGTLRTSYSAYIKNQYLNFNRATGNITITGYVPNTAGTGTTYETWVAAYDAVNNTYTINTSTPNCFSIYDFNYSIRPQLIQFKNDYEYARNGFSPSAPTLNPFLSVEGKTSVMVGDQNGGTWVKIGGEGNVQIHILNSSFLQQTGNSHSEMHNDTIFIQKGVSAPITSASAASFTVTSVDSGGMVTGLSRLNTGNETSTNWRNDGTVYGLCKSLGTNLFELVRGDVTISTTTVGTTAVNITAAASVPRGVLLPRATPAMVGDVVYIWRKTSDVRPASKVNGSSIIEVVDNAQLRMFDDAIVEANRDGLFVNGQQVLTSGGSPVIADLQNQIAALMQRVSALEAVITPH